MKYTCSRRVVQITEQTWSKKLSSRIPKRGRQLLTLAVCVEVDFIDVVAYKKHSLVALSSWYYGPQSKSFLASWVNQCFGFCCSKDIKSIVNLSAAPLLGKYTLQARQGVIPLCSVDVSCCWILIQIIDIFFSALYYQCSMLVGYLTF